MSESTSPVHVTRARFVRCGWLVAGAGAPVRDGGLFVRRGRIERVLGSAGHVRRFAAELGRAPTDLGDGILAPGFVNAHAHLELSALRGRVPRGKDFRAWVGALLRERAKLGAAELARAAGVAADELVAGGTTLVADVDALGLALLPRHALRRIAFHELLDARDPARTSPALERVRRALGRRGPASHGLSPHAPLTVSSELFALAAQLSRARRARVMIHWAESAEEERWLEHGDGPFAGLLDGSPRRRGLELIEAARLLGPRTLLVHGNQASARERERVARSGAALVHCPGTHAFFRRARFDLESWRAAGVPLALGTDSLASNAALDMRAELVGLRRAHPELEPREAFGLATRAGARALGLAGTAGELVEGARADLVLYARGASEARGVWPTLTEEIARVAAVWIAGALAFPGPVGDGKGARRLDFRGPPPQ